MFGGLRRNDVKGRMTPRRLSRFDWFMTWVARIGKILVIGMLVVWFCLWVWADGTLTRAEDWTHNKIAGAAAGMGLRLQDVIVEGRHNLPAETIKAAVGAEPGDPLLSVDLAELREELQKNPWVKNVSVRRALPDRLVITLIERQPLAIWLDAPGMPGIVDADGVVLTQTGFENYGPMLAVTGKDSEKQAAKLIALLQGQPDVAVRIKKAEFISQRRWDLVIDGGTVVKLPEADAGYALARLSKAQNETKIMDQSLKSIDLRQSDRIILENQPGDIRDLLLKDADPV